VDGEAPYVVPLFTQAVGAAADVAVLVGGRRQREWTGAVGQADTLAELASETVARLPAVLPPTAASVLLMHAELSRVRGTADPGAWHEAASAWEGVGDGCRVAYAQWREAEAHIAGGSGRAAASAAATAALRTAAGVGAEHVREAVEALVRRTRLSVPVGGDGPSAGADPFRLTRREREVLELVAEGRTDRQIGERLYISHRTAERHVSNLLAKLGACTRAEMAAVAHRCGLVRGS
jgi:DNA-binding CsgD family transcriptional regulator